MTDNTEANIAEALTRVRDSIIAGIRGDEQDAPRGMIAASYAEQIVREDFDAILAEFPATAPVPNPDTTALIARVQAKYAKYEQAIGPGGDKAWSAGLLASDIPELLRAPSTLNGDTHD